jgi:hypothetical protein
LSTTPKAEDAPGASLKGRCDYICQHLPSLPARARVSQSHGSTPCSSFKLGRAVLGIEDVHNPVHITSCIVPSVPNLEATPTPVSIIPSNINTTFSILSWNINGRLRLHLDCPDFRSQYLNSADIIAFHETHLRPDEHALLPTLPFYNLFHTGRPAPFNFALISQNQVVVLSYMPIKLFRTATSYRDIRARIVFSLIESATLKPKRL